MVRNIYKTFGWDPKVEKKWAAMDTAERSEFALQVRKLCDSHNDIVLHAIVVKKANVLPHIRLDANKCITT
jgi:hypothetical protein